MENILENYDKMLAVPVLGRELFSFALFNLSKCPPMNMFYVDTN